MSIERANFRKNCSANEFREILKHFKRNGCNLLVTGAVSEDVTVRATRTLLGAPDADRKRVVALGDFPRRNVGERLPPNVDSDDPSVWTIDRDANHHSIPETARTADVDLQAVSDSRDGLSRLREEVSTAIDYFSEVNEELSSAELRLSMFSVGRLVREHDFDAVARFVRSISGMVRDVRGMAHYHFARPDDDEAVTRFSDLFDARIELRKRDNLWAEQRWHLPGYEQPTDWVRL